MPITPAKKFLSKMASNRIRHFHVSVFLTGQKDRQTIKSWTEEDIQLDYLSLR